MTVAEIMSREVVTIRPDATAHDLAMLLSEKRVSGVPVLDAGQALVGVVSQTDLMTREGRLVSDIMTPFVYTASEDMCVNALADLMLDKQVHRVVVVRGVQVVGIVSSLDLIRALREQLIRQNVDQDL